MLIGEAHEAPESWDLVSRAGDDHDEKGLYLLTGSARPRDDAEPKGGPIVSETLTNYLDVLELSNGRWAAFEIKLGEAVADAAATALLRFAGKVDTARHGDPLVLVAITGGRFTYRRADGVIVLPITALAASIDAMTSRRNRSRGRMRPSAPISVVRH